LIRIGGLEGALAGRIENLRTFLQQKVPYNQVVLLVEDEERARWQTINNLTNFADFPNILKVPLASRQLPELDAQLASIAAKRHYSAGANLAWIALEDSHSLEKILHENNCAGLRIKGQFGQPIIGKQNGQAIYQRMKQALDPHGTFWSNLAQQTD
jgi:hypothetical protein